MRLLLHFAVTLVLAVTAGLGVGSGGLYLIWLQDAQGLSHTLSVGGNLVFFIAALLSAALMNLRKGRIDLRFLLTVLLFGIPSALLGQRLATQLPPTLLRLFLGVFLIFSGIFTLVVQKKARVSSKSSAPALDKNRNKDYNNK